MSADVETVTDRGEAPAGSGRGRYLGPGLVAGGVLMATAYVALVDPGEPGHYPLCPLKYVTGLDCPACGGLRSVHALAHGDLGAALDQNLAVVLLLPVAVVLWARWVRRLRAEDARGGQVRTATVAPTAAAQGWRRLVPYALLVLLLVFTVVRNLPFVPFLRSGLG